MTTKEKKLYIFIGVLVLALASFVFSYWALDAETQVEGAFTLQSPEGTEVLSGQVQQEIPRREESERDHSEDPSSQSMEEPLSVYVDVKGAIHNPGVYEMTEDERIIDAIDTAGGILEDGTTEIINLAQPLTDGMVIYVPFQEELEQEEDQSQRTHVSHSPHAPSNGDSGNSVHFPTSSTSFFPTEEPQSGKININTASTDELVQLTGVGPSRAEAIVDYREKNGGFAQKEDLKNVSGIGEKTFEKLEDDIEI
ncbi:ComEA family DNA-binding protein [Caldalkalibacillus salinus]|uniref:ComEA family DNA-binding protein n=1 Tax=Caldalkalibacillus salinus TaxID=2803787 RepID=UPI00192344C3|nr:ComEA family DNA-binding protein [Caldalkalibacillus salinus]